MGRSCPGCGHVGDAHASACAACGQALPADAAPSSPVAASPSRVGPPLATQDIDLRVPPEPSGQRRQPRRFRPVKVKEPSTPGVTWAILGVVLVALVAAWVLFADQIGSAVRGLLDRPSREAAPEPAPSD